jgi:hypothetical protein
MNIKEIGQKPLKQRLLYFVLTLVIWFFIANQINTSCTDAVEKAENLRTLWIVSGFIIAILWSIFLPKKIKNDIEEEK